MADKNMEAQISVEFEEATSRQSLNSGERINILWSKVKRWLSDLKAVAFSGSYSDLSDTPTTATTAHDGLMSAADKTKLDGADDTYALKSKYGNSIINVGRKEGTAVGSHSTAEGLDTIASGYYSHAEGQETTANGNNSCHSEGQRTTASGMASHAEGVSTNKVTDLITDFSWQSTTNDDIINAWNTQQFSIAHGNASHVEGHNNLSLGHASHSEGLNTVAVGNQSHTSGYYTKALHDNEFACGTYNESKDDTLFSVGDGTVNSRHNAFEITTTGGKLHDKDIATTDIIPDLSAYAKTADVPNIKVNAAVNADKIEGFNAQKLFCQRVNLASKDLNDCVELGSYFFNGINANAPISNGTISAGAYGVVDNIIYNKDFIKQTCQFIHGGSAYLGRMFVRYYDKVLDSWSEWKEIYTEASKPYITGSATVAANSGVCVTNHGFTPSAVIWWDGNVSGVAVSFSSTQFVMNSAQTTERTVNYLIFK